MKIHNEVYDFIGVGIGPFNLGLAALASKTPLNSLFFEAKSQFEWHAGLLMEDCTLQVPMMADLVTMADPTSPYSYLNYLRQTNRLYAFYFYEDFLIPRQDYNNYCQWVCQQLNQLKFGQRVIDVIFDAAGYRVTVACQQTQQLSQYVCKNLVVGIGTSPYWPANSGQLQHPNCLHSGQYLTNKAQLQQLSSITILGSGQSAAEIYLDLLNEQNSFDYELNWLTRSAGFLPMEYSKLGLEHFSPDYINHFYQLDSEVKEQTRQQQNLWYKGISSKTIGEIYDRLYKRSIANQAVKTRLQARSQLEQVQLNGQQLSLNMSHIESQQAFQLNTDALICATGYQVTTPQFLQSISDHFRFDHLGRPTINLNYQLEPAQPKSAQIYMQNAEIHSHGIGAPDLGLGAHRNAVIINNLLEQAFYPVQQKNVFQTFGVHPDWQTNATSTARSTSAVL